MASALSSYLHNKAPSMYGDQQADYLKRAEAAIQGAVQMMRSSKDPAELFFKVFEAFRKERADIALKHGTKDAPCFGALRNAEKLPQELNYGNSFTPLGDSYAEYNRILMKQLRAAMSGMDCTLNGRKTRRVEHRETVLGRKVAFDVQLLERHELVQLKWDRFSTDTELQSVLKTDKSVWEITRDRHLMKELKRVDAELYKKVGMECIVRFLATTFPSPKLTKVNGETFLCEGNTNNLKSLYALGTFHLEIQGELYAMFRVFTWLYRAHQEDPVARMEKCSTAILLHQDPFLIDDTLQEISRMFQKALLWDPKKEGVKELKDRVALLRFTYAHCMPCFRGDGALGDWLELAIYRFHGFADARHNPNRLPCFEPLASLSLSHYLKRYDQAISVEKGSSSSEEKKEIKSVIVD